MSPDSSCCNISLTQGILQGGEANERKLYDTFLASAFRTLRFGIHEAHGRGMAVHSTS